MAQGEKPRALPKTLQTNPTDRAPLQEQDKQQEPEKVAEPSKGNLRQDTPRKTAGAAGRGTEANSSQWLNNSQPRA